MTKKYAQVYSTIVSVTATEVTFTAAESRVLQPACSSEYVVTGQYTVPIAELFQPGANAVANDGSPIPASVTLAANNTGYLYLSEAVMGRHGTAPALKNKPSVIRGTTPPLVQGENVLIAKFPQSGAPLVPNAVHTITATAMSLTARDPSSGTLYPAIDLMNSALALPNQSFDWRTTSTVNLTEAGFNSVGATYTGEPLPIEIVSFKIEGSLSGGLFDSDIDLRSTVDCMPEQVVTWNDPTTDKISIDVTNDGAQRFGATNSHVTHAFTLLRRHVEVVSAYKLVSSLATSPTDPRLEKYKETLSSSDLLVLHNILAHEEVKRLVNK